MKKNKNINKIIALCLVASVLNLSPVLAQEYNNQSNISQHGEESQEINKNLVNIKFNTKLPNLILTDDSIMIFESIEDYNSYIQTLNTNKTSRYIPIYSTSSVISSVTERQKFLAYHPNTPSWRKATNYLEALTSSKTYGSTLKVQDLTVKFDATFSKGVTANLPADPNRYSKLGFAVDVKADKILIREYESGTNRLIKSYYTTVALVQNKYTNVYYQ